jgi:hypothetical protein
MHPLVAESRRLRSWGAAHGLDPGCDDIISAYPRWRDVYQAWHIAVTGGDVGRHFNELAEEVIYLIISDWRDRRLAAELRTYDERAFFRLAALGHARAETDVVLQCVKEMHDAADRDHADALLLEFAATPDTCVQLHALAALTTIGSDHVPRIAEQLYFARESTAELRCVCLFAAAMVGAPSLDSMLLHSDGSGEAAVEAAARAIAGGKQVFAGDLRRTTCVSSQATTMRALHRQAQLFRDWARTVPLEQQVGEWECAYNDWGETYRRWLAVAQHIAISTWPPSLQHDMLHLLARDNENRVLVRAVGEHGPRYLVELSQIVLVNGDPEAQYQCAEALGQHADYVGAIALLEEFCGADDPYVRRIALSQVLDHDPRGADALVARVWSQVPQGDLIERELLLKMMRTLAPALAKHYSRND